ncbi:hypothetical protein [Arthrobacter sp. UYEF36]|uniref:hypothetical protein n=1 Tax=Arthrobacter sp. UYEF36 TaxID=1756366 RepID=UPI003392FD0E
MDENLKFALTLVAGAAGGALVAGLFAVAGAWIANKREHRQWLRNERLRSYETYMTETRPWAVDSWSDVSGTMTKEADAASLQLRLIAPKKVVEACYRLEQQISDFRGFAKGHFTQAVSLRRDDDFERALRLHVHNMEQRTRDLAEAMRISLQLPRRDAQHWTNFINEDAPSREEFLERVRAHEESLQQT